VTKRGTSQGDKGERDFRVEKRERFKGNGKETLQDNEGKCPLGTGYEEDILEESMMNRGFLRSYAVCGVVFEI